MNFKLVLIFVLLEGFHFRTHKRMDSRRTMKVQNIIVGSKQWKELRKNQNPWEDGTKMEAILNLRGVAIKNNSFLWFNKQIPYEVDNDFTKDEKQLIKNALYEIGRGTCIKPRPRKKMDTESILFVKTPGRGCYSWIGSHHILQQHIYLDPSKGCVTEATIKHEFLHAVGLFHVQSAPDRDEYVKINWENIRRGAEGNFKISTWPVTRFDLPYDYNSLMHYSAYAFSKNGLPTMEPKKTGVKLLRKYNLSEYDVLAINKLYQC